MSGHNHGNIKNIGLAFWLNVFLFFLEIIGGVMTNSVTIIANAIHDIGDIISLAFAWSLEKMSFRPGNSKYSFGYSRLSILSSLINVVILILGSLFVVKESVYRIINPQVVNYKQLLLFAIIGVIVNSIAMVRLLKYGKNHSNIRVVGWHLLEDSLSWLLILLLAIVNSILHWNYLDPILSIVISLYILRGVLKEGWKVITIFLQKNIAGVSLKELIENIGKINNVASVHHIHLWSLDDEHHVFTCHVVTNSNEIEEIQLIKREIRSIIEKFNIFHTTIEIESPDENCSILEDNCYKLND